MRKNFVNVFISIIIAAMLIMGSVSMAFAESSDSESFRDSADNLYVAGNDEVVEGGVFFAGFAAGKDLVIINSESEDSIAMAGMTLTLDNVKAGGSLFLAGSELSLKQVKADGNLMAAGYSISVDENSSVRAMTAAAKEVYFYGEAKALNIGAEKVVLAGKVDGDAIISADSVEIAKDAVISGTLKIESQVEPSIPKGAKIGNYEFSKLEEKESNVELPVVSSENKLKHKALSALYWSVAMSILGLILYWLGRKHVKGASEMIQNRTGAMLGSGAIALIVTPLACLILLFTIVGIPVSLLAGFAYMLAICVSVAFTGASLGLLLIKKIPGWLAVIIGIVILEVLKKIPYLGIIISIGAVLYTLGYIIQHIYLSSIKKQKVVSGEESFEYVRVEN